jgi:hypothetical protein
MIKRIKKPENTNFFDVISTQSSDKIKEAISKIKHESLNLNLFFSSFI